VLIDYDGAHDYGNAELLALRLAPLQLSWIGFPGSTAGPAVDYLLADAVVAPPELEHLPPPPPSPPPPRTLVHPPPPSPPPSKATDEKLGDGAASAAAAAAAATASSSSGSSRLYTERLIRMPYSFTACVLFRSALPRLRRRRRLRTLVHLRRRRLLLHRVRTLQYECRRVWGGRLGSMPPPLRMRAPHGPPPPPSPPPPRTLVHPPPPSPPPSKAVSIMNRPTPPRRCCCCCARADSWAVRVRVEIMGLIIIRTG
jgi:hypothetical protein